MPIPQREEPAMLSIEVEREEDGRWIAEISELLGVVTYGDTESEAKTKAIALAFHVIADRIEHNEDVPINVRDFFIAA
jgi:predicted RNase H-like HicB family nuclease